MAATLVVIAGAAASIATSQVQEAPPDDTRWALSELADLPPVVLDATTPRAGFLLRIGFAAPLERPAGSWMLSLNVDLDEGTAAFHVATTERSTGAVGTMEFVQDATTTAAPGTGMPAWRLDCRTGCVSEFEVWIDRTDGGINPAVVSGVFDVDLIETAGAAEPPGGVALTLEVTPL